MILINSVLVLLLGFVLIIFSWSIDRLAVLRKAWAHPLVWICLAAVFFLIARWPAITMNRSFDQDEVMILSALQRMTVAPVMWRDIDGYSSGPLNYYPLFFLQQLGVPMSYSFLHLYGSLLILAAVSIFVWSQRSAVAALLGTSTLIMLGTTHHATLLSCATELPSLVLIAIACARLPKVRSGSTSDFLLGLCLGLLPFAKLQGAPLGLVMGACALGFRRGNWNSMVSLTVGGLTPALFVVGYAYFGGFLPDFWQRYILYSAHYVAAVPGLEKFWLLPIFSIGEPFSLVLWVLVGAGIVVGFGSLHPKSFLGHSVLLFFAIVMTSIATMYAPGNGFIHYTFYLLVPWLFFLFCFFSALPVTQLPAVRRACVALAVICLLWPFPKVGVFAGLQLPVRTSQQLAEALDIPPGQTLGVWGWAPDYYVDLQAIPFSRETATSVLTVEWPGMQVLREKYKQDMIESPPFYFVEAVGEGQLLEDKEKYGLESWPWLVEYLKDNYEIIAKTPNDAVRVWKKIR